MKTADRARTALHETESRLKELLAEAASEGDYSGVVEVAALAKSIRDILKHNSTAQPRITEKASSSRRSGVSRRSTSTLSYPRFERRDQTLVRISWSKGQRREYEQRTPFSTVMQVVSAIAEAGADDRVFSTEALSPIIDETADEIPSYQLYVVIGLLLQAGLIEQHGRRGYSILRPSEFQKQIATLWQNLPTR